MPDLKGEGGGVAAALLHRPFVASAGGMRIDAVGLAEGDVDVSTVGKPAGLAGREVLIRIGDPGIVLIAEFIFRAVRVGVAPLPEHLDKLLTLLLVGEVFERPGLFVRDDPAHILVQPLLILRAQLVLDGFTTLELFFIAQPALQRIGFFLHGLIFGHATVIRGRLCVQVQSCIK